MIATRWALLLGPLNILEGRCPSDPWLGALHKILANYLCCGVIIAQGVGSICAGIGVVVCLELAEKQISLFWVSQRKQQLILGLAEKQVWSFWISRRTNRLMLGLAEKQIADFGSRKEQIS